VTVAAFVAVLVIFAAVAVLALRYGADTRPGVDRPPEGWLAYRDRAM
jgi:hypothetical protein